MHSEPEDKYVLNAARCANIVDTFVLCLFFALVVGKILQPRILSPMADNAITRDSIGGLGSPLYIFGSSPGHIYVFSCSIKNHLCSFHPWPYRYIVPNCRPEVGNFCFGLVTFQSYKPSFTYYPPWLPGQLIDQKN